MPQNNKGILLEEVLKLVVYVMIFVGLIYLGIKLYNQLIENREEMQAKATLELIKKAMERAKEENEASLLVYAPQGWKIVFFPKNLKKVGGIEKPSLSFDKNVVCITNKKCNKFYFVVDEDLPQAKIEIKKVVELMFTFDNQYHISLTSLDVSPLYFEEKEEYEPSQLLAEPSSCKEKDLDINIICEKNEKACNVKNLFKNELKLKNINFSNNDDGTEYINPALNETIKEFDNKIEEINKEREEKILIYITDGYSIHKNPRDHISSCHMVYGTCIDVVVFKYKDNKNNLRFGDDDDWDIVKDIALDLCFYVYDERKPQKGKWTGSHFHLDRCYKGLFCNLPSA